MSARCKSPGLRFLVVATVAGKVVAAEVVTAATVAGKVVAAEVVAGKVVAAKVVAAKVVAAKVVAAEVVAAEVEDDYAWARSCGSWSSSTAICCWFIMNPILFNW